MTANQTKVRYESRHSWKWKSVKLNLVEDILKVCCSYLPNAFFAFVQFSFNFLSSLSLSLHCLALVAWAWDQLVAHRYCQWEMLVTWASRRKFEHSRRRRRRRRRCQNRTHWRKLWTMKTRLARERESWKHYWTKNLIKMGCRYSSVDSSAPSTLPPRVRVPSTPSTLFSIYIVRIVYLSFKLECEKDENKQKEAGNGPFFKKKNLIKLEAICGG